MLVIAIVATYVFLLGAVVAVTIPFLLIPVEALVGRLSRNIENRFKVIWIAFASLEVTLTFLILAVASLLIAWLIYKS